MLTICPWGYPPGKACVGCKYGRKCALQPEQQKIVINGLFGVWRIGTTLLIENTSSRLTLSAAHLDSLIAVLQATQQEMHRPAEV